MLNKKTEKFMRDRGEVICQKIIIINLVNYDAYICNYINVIKYAKH